MAHALLSVLIGHRAASYSQTHAQVAHKMAHTDRNAPPRQAHRAKAPYTSERASARDWGDPKLYPTRRSHNAKLMEAFYRTPRCCCFAKSGVSKNKVRAIRYIHDLPAAPSNQCWGGLGGRSPCPHKNSLFHPKPRTLTNTTLPNIDWRGRGRVGVDA